MSDGYNQGNDPRTSDSNAAQNAGNATSQQGQQNQDQQNQDQQNQSRQNQGTTGQSGAGYGDQGGQGATGQSGTSGAGQQDQGQSGLDHADESRGGPPTGETVDDTGGLTSDEGSRTGQGGMQQDAIGSAQGSELDDEDSDTLEDQNSSGAV